MCYVIIRLIYCASCFIFFQSLFYAIGCNLSMFLLYSSVAKWICIFIYSVETSSFTKKNMTFEISLVAYHLFIWQLLGDILITYKYKVSKGKSKAM